MATRGESGCQLRGYPFTKTQQYAPSSHRSRRRSGSVSGSAYCGRDAAAHAAECSPVRSTLGMRAGSAPSINAVTGAPNGVHSSPRTMKSMSDRLQSEGATAAWCPPTTIRVRGEITEFRRHQTLEAIEAENGRQLCLRFDERYPHASPEIAVCVQTRLSCRV